MVSTPTSDGAPVIVEIVDGVASMTLNNPRRKNAITLEMAGLIEGFCERVEQDPAVGAVVVRSAGDYFCSGADTRDLATSSDNPAAPDAVARTSAVYGSFVRIGSLPVPTIAGVIGGAVGAGLNLALAVDVMVVTPETELDSGFLARSIHPGGGHLSLLGRRVDGRRRSQWPRAARRSPDGMRSSEAWRTPWSSAMRWTPSSRASRRPRPLTPS